MIGVYLTFLLENKATTSADVVHFLIILGEEYLG